MVFTDDICDYFGVKIAMYFAWLGFYTTSMLYPAVIGFVLWMLTESDQVRRDPFFQIETNAPPLNDRKDKLLPVCVFCGGVSDEP